MQFAGSPEGVTQLLRSVRNGSEEAEERLIPLIYAELHTLAARLMRFERPDHTLQPTALVNEAYLRLAADRQTDWKDRTHFFAVAAQVMRHVLVDHARKRLSGKRGSGIRPINADFAIIISEDRLDDLILLDELLQKLELEDPRSAQVVICYFFGGLNIDEIAEAMKLSTRSIKRDLSYGRAWLKARLKK